MEVQDSGNLSQKGFLALLVDLHQQGATGSLKLERAPLQKAVYFRDGQILFAASNDPHDQLASILVEEGKLSSEQMQVAQARVSAGNPLAKVLTELGYISQRELADAARLKVEKILTDLYNWKEGSYQFVERSLPKGAIDLELNTPRLLFNSIRRIQEREWVLEQLGRLDLVLAAGPGLESFLSEAKPDPSAGEVLRLVDGVKTAKQIGAVSALGEFEVCKILSAALMIGALQKGPGAPEASATPEQAPAEPPLSPPSDDRAPLPPSLAETTALNIEDVAARPPQGPSGTVVDTAPPVPLDQLERSATPPSRPAANFVFDESPISSEAPKATRIAPRPRKMSGGGGESSKKLLFAVLVLAVLGGGGWAAYKYLWPTGESGAAPSTSTTAPTTDGTPTSPSPTPPQASGGTPSTSTTTPTTAPGQGTPQPTPPPSATTSGTAVPTSTPPTTKPSPPPSTSRPPRPTGSTTPTGGTALASGHDQLEKGNYPQAAATFLGHLRKVGTDKFTIAVGVFCDTGNVSRVVRNSGGSDKLLLLAFNDKGRSCYRVFWGIFNSRAEAQRALGSIPNGVRARDSAAVPIARLLR